jgi:hypothetical protein
LQYVLRTKKKPSLGPLLFSFLYPGQGDRDFVQMFSLRMSYMALLQAVAQRCCLPYVSTIHPVIDDGTDMYGVELELPAQVAQGISTQRFFWANPGDEQVTAYEFAALQALTAL